MNEWINNLVVVILVVLYIWIIIIIIINKVGEYNCIDIFVTVVVVVA